MDSILLYILVLFFLLKFGYGNPTGWLAFSSSTKFWFSNSTADFSLARDYCKRMEARLVVLSENEEYAFIMDWLSKTVQDKSLAYYVNAERNDITGSIEWGDGSEFPGAARFGPYQPDDTDKTQNCASLRYDRGQYWIFDDHCTRDDYRFICEQNIDQTWGEWEGWSTCSSSCVVGFKSRKRKCQTVGSGGWNLCSFDTFDNEIQTCNDHLCNDTIRLTTVCNSTCNETGIQTRITACKSKKLFPQQCSNITITTCDKKSACSQISNPRSGQAPPSDEENTDGISPVIIAIIVVATVVLIIAILCIIVLARRKKLKKNEKCNTDQLSRSRNVSTRPASFTYKHARSNLYSVTEISSFEKSEEPTQDFLQQHIEETTDGAYVTFRFAKSNKEKSGNTEDQDGSKQRSYENHETSNTVDRSTLSTSTIDNPSHSQTNIDDSSGYITQEQLENGQAYPQTNQSTLEFDYVSMKNFELEDNSYTRLESLHGETKNWAETYNVLSR